MIRPDKNGFYGEYGGAFIPEMLHKNVEELAQNYEKIIFSISFQEEYQKYLKEYVGRPTPLTEAKNLSQRYGCKIYLKREDLCHTGAHKINNAIGQVLLAKYMNKKKIIAETGAGQHGVATATACALLNMPCEIFMGAKDIERQQLNVLRMKMLGAKVVPANSGSQTLKDATNEAIRAWIQDPENIYYVIGSVVGPHPYPDMVALLQAVISKEIHLQLNEKNLGLPNYVIACIGGGSNAIGAFFEFIQNGYTQLIAVEAAGEGIDTPKTAATIALGKKGILHGSLSYLIQTDDGQIFEPHSISAGLDYPGIGPIHSFLHDKNLVKIIHATDYEALQAAFEISNLEGIIPALESAHAFAALKKLTFLPTDLVVINLSGRGDKDMSTYQKFFKNYEQITENLKQ